MIAGGSGDGQQVLVVAASVVEQEVAGEQEKSLEQSFNQDSRIPCHGSHSIRNTSALARKGEGEGQRRKARAREHTHTSPRRGLFERAPAPLLFYGLGVGSCYIESLAKVRGRGSFIRHSLDAPSC